MVHPVYACRARIDENKAKNPRRVTCALIDIDLDGNQHITAILERGNVTNLRSERLWQRSVTNFYAPE